IDDILQLSRARRMETNFEEVASRTLVDEVLERLETQIEESEALIWVSPDLPELHVNVTWATQAIYNLVSNALKYSSAAQAPDIQIDVYDGLEQPGLVIRDRGIGIQPMHAERIFELFQRAVGREVEGTGAGLAIVREVAQRHRGNVWVQPHAGGGSEFYITFGQPVDIFDEVFI
ncbi:MAG: sensor histidine kinase, partial [Candidatus Promineifilaceae bacterium]